MLEPPKLPPLTSVRAFEAAARHGSFALAARELGFSAQVDPATGLSDFATAPLRA